MTTAAAIALTLVLGALASGQQPPRDSTVRTATGTAAISGVIVTDDTEHRPVRRARVSINSSDRDVGRTVITDDAGAFSFSALPAARYSLSATKAGFVTVAYGATRPTRPGTAIALADAQQVTGLTVRIQHGSVITGTLVDQNREPAVGISVSALRRSTVSGTPRLAFSGARAETGDRGVYRIHSLAAGDYAVAASVGPGSFSSAGDIRLMTETGIRSALDLLRAGGSGSSVQRVAGVTPPSDSVPTIGYAPVLRQNRARRRNAATATAEQVPRHARERAGPRGDHPRNVGGHR